MKKSFIFMILPTLLLGGVILVLLSFWLKKDEANEYQYDLAIMNKSFKRDLERSVILYQSFERYFLGADKTPFFIVIPAKDWDLFVNRFKILKDNNDIKNTPQFISEQEVFERCNEPDVSGNGNIAQQVVKLCFGSTKIAKNYIMMDSDNYFTKDFNPKILFKNGVLKTFAWKLPKSRIENNKNRKLGCCASPIMRNNGQSITAYDMHVFIKDFFGNKNQEFYEFVTSPFLFDSNALIRMKKLIDKKGGYKIATLIRLIPFEMQWYGEYMLQHENFINIDGIMTVVNSPDECHPEDGGSNSYGFCFQSVIYDYENHGPAKNNDQLIYVRPAHCN